MGNVFGMGCTTQTNVIDPKDTAPKQPSVPLTEAQGATASALTQAAQSASSVSPGLLTQVENAGASVLKTVEKGALLGGEKVASIITRNDSFIENAIGAAASVAVGGGPIGSMVGKAAANAADFAIDALEEAFKDDPPNSPASVVQDLETSEKVKALLPNALDAAEIAIRAQTFTEGAVAATETAAKKTLAKIEDELTGASEEPSSQSNAETTENPNQTLKTKMQPSLVMRMLATAVPKAIAAVLFLGGLFALGYIVATGFTATYGLAVVGASLLSGLSIFGVSHWASKKNGTLLNDTAPTPSVK